MPIDVDAAYRRYGPLVLRRCRRFLREESLSVDAMQDVFVQLLRERDRLDERGTASLLLQMATHQCLNRIRSHQRRPEEGDPEGQLIASIAAVGDVAASTEARSVLDRLFRRTPASTRTIAVMHLVDGLTLEEVASEVGLSISGVRKRLRALRESIPDVGEI